eukprot:TRINITY_DN4198_c0_g2_i1.p1 TRINITY_DN4198_c0_g2~~TRINITY_DN4198_c0_g2_i1.p1  ORF type:complete len:394 (+),score=58.19 TRINITY_DN4198_c0_g2_i1:138-1184(+)
MVSNTGSAEMFVNSPYGDLNGYQGHHHRTSFSQISWPVSDDSGENSPLTGPLSVGSSPTVFYGEMCPPSPPSPVPVFHRTSSVYSLPHGCTAPCCTRKVSVTSLPHPAGLPQRVFSPLSQLSETASEDSVIVEKTKTSHVVVLQFKWGRQDEFLTDRFYSTGTFLVASADRGRDMGMVASCRVASFQETTRKYVQRILSIATDEEVSRWKTLSVEEKTARKIAQKVLAKAGVAMKVVHAEYQFDMKKVTFHYTSQASHPDFRIALDTLFSLLRVRIWFSRYSNLDMDAKNKAHLEANPSILATFVPNVPEQNEVENEEDLGGGITNAALQAAWKKAKKNKKRNVSKRV